MCGVVYPISAAVSRSAAGPVACEVNRISVTLCVRQACGEEVFTPARAGICAARSFSSCSLAL